MRKDRIYTGTIQRNNKVKNVYGQYTDSWVDVCTQYFSKEELLGNEYYSAQQSQTGVKVKFETEYVDGITREMRLKIGDKYYDIIDVVNVKGYNRDLLLYCKEVIK